MTQNQPNGEQFSFKAWVENEGAAKLHVHGEVYVADESLLYQLDRKDPQGYFEDELFLEIKPDPTPGSHKVEIKYHEEVSDSPYKKVTIFAMNEEVFQINEIHNK